MHAERLLIAMFEGGAGTQYVHTSTIEWPDVAREALVETATPAVLEAWHRIDAQQWSFVAALDNWTGEPVLTPADLGRLWHEEACTWRTSPYRASPPPDPVRVREYPVLRARSIVTVCALGRDRELVASAGAPWTEAMQDPGERGLASRCEAAWMCEGALPRPEHVRAALGPLDRGTPEDDPDWERWSILGAVDTLDGRTVLSAQTLARAASVPGPG